MNFDDYLTVDYYLLVYSLKELTKKKKKEETTHANMCVCVWDKRFNWKLTTRIVVEPMCQKTTQLHTYAEQTYSLERLDGCGVGVASRNLYSYLNKNNARDKNEKRNPLCWSNTFVQH